jgi:ABC-type transporter Mla subunit MlaD
LHRVQHANQNLGKLVDKLAADEERIRITPENLSVLLSELLRVGERVQSGGVPENDPELSAAVQQYRNLLERLRDLLPSLQACLLTERARLEAERSHLEAAHAWAATSKYTG